MVKAVPKYLVFSAARVPSSFIDWMAASNEATRSLPSVKANPSGSEVRTSSSIETASAFSP